MRLIVLGLCILAIAAVPAQAGKGAGNTPKVVQVYVAVPPSYTSTVTPAQAIQAVPLWLDEINVWFSRDLGQSFRYSVQTFPLVEASFARDACGSFTGNDVYFSVTAQMKGAGIDFQRNRVMVLVMGAGGWAGHFSPQDRGVNNAGLVGDWGVMEQFGSRNTCVPDWDYPNRGFSHEFAGMMGMYVGGGCYQDGQGCFVNDPLSVTEKEALLRYSGKWLS